MNSKEELAAKREAKRVAIKKDRQGAKRIIQYMYFYFAVLVVLSLVTYVFNLVFHKLEHGNFGSNYYSPFEGFGYFMFLGFWIFPLSIFYNFIINIFDLYPLPCVCFLPD
jgi:hypothetical protein